MQEKPVALIKIGKKNNQKRICELGQFYMNTARFFYENARDDSSGLVYDLHEMSLPRGLILKCNGVTLTPFNSEDDDAGYMNLGINTCIFCFYAVLKEQIKATDIGYSITIPKEMLQGIIQKNNPKEYEVIIIKKPGEVLGKIAKELNDKHIPYRMDYVLYDDHDFKFNICDIYDINKFALELSFHKSKKFSKQNEYRIAIVNDRDEPRKDIKIGKLSADEFSKFDVDSYDCDLTIDF